MARLLRGGGGWVRGVPLYLYILAQTLSTNFFCRNTFPAILRQKKKKIPIATARGGGEALGAESLRKELFLWLLLVTL